MDYIRLVACLVASLPAGWAAGALFERVPARRSLISPIPRPQFTGIYLTIQICVSALFVLAAIRFEDDSVGTLIAYLVFFAALVALSAIDLDTLRLPDLIVGGMMVVGIPLITVVSVVGGAPVQIQHALAGATFYFVFLLLAHLAFPRGMGFGDVKLSPLLGLFVGWLAVDGVTSVSLVLYAMLTGFIGGAAIGLLLFSFRRKSRPYPFGPFLMGGAILVIMFSSQLLPS